MITFQEGPPELPGDVAVLPLDAVTWVLLLASATLVLWWAAALGHRFLQRRQSQHANLQAAVARARPTSALASLEELRALLTDLSATQKVEAARLSWLLREEVGRRWCCDCHSATAQQLLNRPAAVVADQAALAPWLGFVTAILYADCPSTIAQWQSTLEEVSTWLLETQGVSA